MFLLNYAICSEFHCQDTELCCNSYIKLELYAIAAVIVECPWLCPCNFRMSYCFVLWLVFLRHVFSSVYLFRVVGLENFEGEGQYCSKTWGEVGDT